MSYRRCGRGGKTSSLTKRQNLSDSTTDEEPTEFDNNLAKAKDMLAATKREMNAMFHRFENEARLLKQSMPEPNKYESPTETADDPPMQINDRNQHLKHKSEVPTSDIESITQNNAEPPPKKRKTKKKKQTDDKTTEDNTIMISNSCTSSPPDATTSLQLNETKADSEIDPPTYPPITASPSISVRNYKVLIRGLPADFNPDHISLEIAKMDLQLVKIIQFKKREGVAYRLLPLFLAVIRETANHVQVLTIRKIQRFPVRVERFRGGQGPLQCYKCQGFGHAQRSCTAPPRCLKCAESHRSFECLKNRETPPKCCNCGKTHTANFSGCEVRPSRKTTRPPRAPTMQSSAYRLVSIVKELQKLLQNEEVVALLQSIMQGKIPIV